jgi:hypothetical protein
MAETLSPEAFVEIFSTPALIVQTTATATGKSAPIAAEASFSATVVQERASTGNADIANYAGRMAFLCKRPGNPFPQVISVGRARNNDLVVALQSISKLHGIFTRVGDDWILGDHGSTNGILVDGERLETRGKRKLVDGNLLRFGADLLWSYLLPSSLYAHLREGT